MSMLRCGIIGCGNIFPMHAYSIKNIENASLCAVCDVQKELADKIAEEFKCEAFYDYKEMIDSGKINAVHICTPHYLHREMALYALSKGLFVVCEKPMSISIEDASEMKKAGDKSGGRFAVIFQNRYNTGSVFAKRWIESKKLGKPLGGKIIVTWYRDDSYYAQADWRGTWEFEGGGAIINQSIHSIDLARWLLDLDFLSADATLKNRIHKTVEVEDEATGILHFSDNVNVLFYATTSYCTDDEIEVVLQFENGVVRIVGNDASVKMKDGACFCPEEEKKPDVDFGGDGKTCWGFSHFKQIKDIYESFENGGNTYWQDQAFETQEIICDIYKNKTV